ncbi:hypothetical protein ABPG75_003797 [Micractinium tetrahymenae]
MPSLALLAAYVALLCAAQASARSDSTLGATAAGASATSAGAGGRSLLGVDPALLRLIKLPPGFKIRTYTDDFVDARNLAVGNRGSSKPVVVYVSTTGDKVHALVDRTGTGTATACTLLSGLDNPNGIAYDGSTRSLYVSEVRRITRWDNVDVAALAGCKASLLRSRQVAGPAVLPEQASHANRFLGLGPDGKLYVTVAAPFNVDVCRDPYCSIHRLNKNGSGHEIFARGIRNAAAWTWHPVTKALVFVGMERDNMGPGNTHNNAPDDLLHSLEKPGIDLRWPYCHWVGGGYPVQRAPGPGTAIADPDVTLPGMTAQRCARVAKKPLQALGPHIAPLGVLYWPRAVRAGQQQWPVGFGNGFFVAEHGSWNRDPPIGYRVAYVQLNANNTAVVRHSIFASGWLQPSGDWGRPTGLTRLPDGSMLVADDGQGTVYRISYEPSTRG